jgi:hypothetical protein
MGKRLMLILAFAIVAGIVAMPAFAEVQNVKVSGDITALGVSRTHFSLGTANAINKADDEESHAASIIRLRVEADLTENVGATIRLINERDWDRDAVSVNEIGVDLGYITLKEFLYSPLTLTIGRQELHFGNDFIIGDPDTNNQVNGTSLTDADLSSKKAFDAVRGTLNYDPLIIDAFWAKVDENTVLGANATPEKDDIDLFGVNARYDFGGNWKTIGELYYFAKIDNSVRDTNTVNNKKKTEINNIGGRIDISPIERLNLQGEAVYQFGKNTASTTDTQVDHEAIGAQGIARYALNMKYNPVLMAIYSFYSGSKTDAGTSRTWDPMYENQTSGHIANVLFNPINSHVLNLRGSMVPVEDLTLTLDYVRLSLAKTPAAGQNLQTFAPDHVAAGVFHTASGKSHLGDEVDLTLKYDYTEDVQLGLLAGMFFPGQAFDGKTQNASELVASVKVSF